MIRSMIRGAAALAFAFTATAALADGGMKKPMGNMEKSEVVIDLGTIAIHDPFARASGRMAQAGGAFFGLENRSDKALHLVDARSDVAKRTELHTTIMDDGVMRMLRLKDGVTLKPGETHWFKRGGDHVMLMGLKRPLENGDKVNIVLVFEKAGEFSFDAPVDNERGGPVMKMKSTKMEHEGGHGMAGKCDHEGGHMMGHEGKHEDHHGAKHEHGEDGHKMGGHDGECEGGHGHEGGMKMKKKMKHAD